MTLLVHCFPTQSNYLAMSCLSHLFLPATRDVFGLFNATWSAFADDEDVKRIKS